MLKFKNFIIIFSIFLTASCAGNDTKLQSAAEMELIDSLQKSNKISRAEAERRKMDIAQKYDNYFDEFDAAYWAKVIEASDRLDRKEITTEQFNAIKADAHAQRTFQQRQIAASNKAAADAADAKLAAKKAADRTFHCYNYSNSTVCR